MAKYLPLPKSLAETDKTFIRDAITATEEVFKGDLFGETNRPLNEPYTTHDGKYHWATNKDLLVYVTELTNTGDIKAANASLYQTLSSVPEYEEPTMMGAPESLSKTSLSSIESKDLIEKYEKREAERAKTHEHDADVQAAIDRQKEIYQEQLKKIAEAEKTTKDKEVYVKTKEPSLTETEQKAFSGLEEQIKTNPEAAVKTLIPEIRSRVDASIPDNAVTLTALNIVANIQTSSVPTIQSHVSDAVAKGTIKLGGKNVQDMAAILSGQSQSLRNMTEAISASAFGQTFTAAVYKETAVADNPESGYTAFSTAYMAPVARNIVETQSSVLQNPGTNIEIETKSFVERWQAEIAKGNVQGGAFRAINVHESLTYFPRGSAASWESVGGDTALNLSTGLSEPMGVVGGLAKMGAQKVAGKAAAAAATKLGFKATLQALGTSVPIIGNVAAFIGGEVLSRINWKTVKKYSAYLIGGITALIALPFAGLGMALGVGALTGLGSLAFGASAGGLTLGGIGGGIGGFIGALAGATLGAIGLPILFTLLGFPVIVALILFIINSGAYMVPPSLQSLGSLNPYIDVSKIANPTGPLQNSALPAKVTYTITVTAKKDSLTNVTIKHECGAITKTGKVPCDAPNINVPGGTVAVGTPFTFSYDASYNSSYRDSLVINTVSVTANVKDEGDSQTAEGGASLTIGNPPTGCLKVDGAWPTSLRSNIESAVATLASKHSAYLSKVCSSYGELLLRYNASGGGGFWGWNHGTYIDFFSVGVKNQADALYTLAHELGHSLAWGSSTAHIFARYSATQGISSESPYCFYSATKHWNPDESFPEAIALYVIEPRCGSVQQKWPIHYRFLQQYILK